MRKTFGQVVRSLRKVRGIPQDDLAHRAGLERAYMGKVERGESNPSLSTIQAIAKALKLKPSELLARMER